MCRYKSEGDPNGLSDCDSLRRQNEMNHDLIRDLSEEIRVLRDRGGFLTPIEEIGLMRLCWFLTLNNVREGASIVRGILERNGTKPDPMMSPMPLPPGPEVPNG